MEPIENIENYEKVDYFKRMMRNIVIMSEDLFSIDEKYEPLRDFARLSEEERKIEGKLDESITINKDEYVITRNGKSYHFMPYTRNNLRENDIEFIRGDKHPYSDRAFRALEIAGSHQLIEPLFLFGKCNGDYKFLVEYRKNGKRYILDILLDTIMESNDYRELMEFEEIRNLDINEIYVLFLVMEEMEGKINILFLLLFYGEVMPYLIDLLEQDFYLSYNDGINIHNINMVDPSCDHIFKLYDDLGVESEDINDITMHPSKYESIKDSKGGYHYKDYVINLLSDNFIGKSKEILLSDERFGRCHYDVYNLANTFRDYFINKNMNYDIRIVTGNVSYYNKRKFYHSWVEVYVPKSQKWIVLDSTQNLIMDKDDFYRYTDADIPVLESIDVDEYNYLHYLFENFGINLNSRLTTIFASDLIRDLNKNIHLLNKRK